MSSNSNTAIEVLSDSRVEAIKDILSENEEYVACFKKIDDRLNELHKIVPKESRSGLYEIDMSLNNIVSIVSEQTYKQGFQDGMNLIKQARTGRKPKHIVMEFESRRKDVFKPYGRTGWLYKLTKVLREYTDEAEVDQDLARLKAGEITEDDLFLKRKKVSS